MAGCSGYEPDERLARINQFSEESPMEALDSLASIDHGSLSEADRHYYDLLSVKATDKAYIEHKSDSLILDVIDFYSSHKSKGLYPLALYYGGRVYSDLGDYPTALRHFQDALDELEECEPKLKSATLSQTGRLLHALRMYSQAIPYIEKAIETSKLLSDSFGVAYDYRQLCHIMLNMERPDLARKYNSEAVKWSESLSNSDQIDMKIDLATILYEERKIDSAYHILKAIPNLDTLQTRGYAFAVAAEIYKDAGVLDTAYMYAHALAINEVSNNRKTGFKLIFSPELRNFIPRDSIITYIQLYKQALEDILNKYDSQEALIQNSFYNYQRHVKARKEAEDTRNLLIIGLLIISAITATLITSLVYKRLYFVRKVLQLHKNIGLLKNINEGINSEKTAEPIDATKQFNLELEKLESMDEPVIPAVILDSDIYKCLRNCVDNKKNLNDKLWSKIEEVVEKSSPDFRRRLESIVNGNLTNSDLQTALLIKCGFKTSEIAILLNRGKTSVSSRRAALARKIFGNNLMTKSIDKVIRSL